jgi:4-aminobutyrate aminotransferase/(S)-3-amino-2-methylpropionate transaminase
VTRPFGARLPELRTPVPGPASHALAERLRAVESRNVTYLSDDWPIFWEEAAGANVRDADGNVYVDLCAGFGVALLGHSHPAVVAAVAEQSRRLVHGMGDVHPPSVRVRLLERLRDLGPWPDARAVLASTGSEAVEIALKTAQLATGKPGVLAFEGGYHGLTLGSLSATARRAFRRPFDERLYPGVAFAPYPQAGVRFDVDADRALERIRALLRDGAPNGDPVGSLIVEPVQGRAGARVPAPGFMAALSALAREADVLIIADEILTGMGRCGAMLASGRVGLEPDLVCVGKALGAGLPVSACLGPRSVMDAWPASEGEALHTSTFLGHPLACAAALAAIDRYGPESVPARAESLGARLRARLTDGLTERLPDEPEAKAGRPSSAAGVVEIRGLGLLLGIELAAHPPAPAARVAAAALREGVLVLPAGDEGQVVELTPPVVLTDEQADHSVEVLVRAIGAAG